MLDRSSDVSYALKISAFRAVNKLLFRDSYLNRTFRNDGLMF